MFKTDSSNLLGKKECIIFWVKISWNRIKTSLFDRVEKVYSRTRGGCLRQIDGRMVQLITLLKKNRSFGKN